MAMKPPPPPPPPRPSLPRELSREGSPIDPVPYAVGWLIAFAVMLLVFGGHH